LSSIAVPGFNGFVGEFLIMMGSFGPRGLLDGWGVALTAVAATGVVLAAAYMLWMVQRVFYGEVTDDHNAHLPDLSPRAGGLGGALAGRGLPVGLARAPLSR